LIIACFILIYLQLSGFSTVHEKDGKRGGGGVVPGGFIYNVGPVSLKLLRFFENQLTNILHPETRSMSIYWLNLMFFLAESVRLHLRC
jgi:hypothetical protein